VTASPRAESHFSVIRTELLHDKAAVASAIMLALIVLFVLLAPWVSTQDPLATNTARRLAPPFSPGYVLGSDE
jgi:peptide/nickel transport system permease protein